MRFSALLLTITLTGAAYSQDGALYQRIIAAQQSAQQAGVTPRQLPAQLTETTVAAYEDEIKSSIRARKMASADRPLPLAPQVAVIPTPSAPVLAGVSTDEAAFAAGANQLIAATKPQLDALCTLLYMPELTAEYDQKLANGYRSVAATWRGRTDWKSPTGRLYQAKVWLDNAGQAFTKAATTLSPVDVQSGNTYASQALAEFKKYGLQADAQCCNPQENAPKQVITKDSAQCTLLAKEILKETSVNGARIKAMANAIDDDDLTPERILRIRQLLNEEYRNTQRMKYIACEDPDAQAGLNELKKCYADMEAGLAALNMFLKTQRKAYLDEFKVQYSGASARFDIIIGQIAAAKQ